jgi:hypothetical protein
MESTTNVEKRISAATYYSFAVGFITTVSCYRLVAAAGLDKVPGSWWLLPFCFFIAAASIPIVFPASRWTFVIVMLAAILFSIVVDATYDFYVNHVDRNLFPLEIVFWWVVTPIPAMLGYWTGLLICRRPKAQPRD